MQIDPKLQEFYIAYIILDNRDLVASCTLQATERGWLIQHFLVSDLVRGLRMGSVFLDQIKTHLKQNKIPTLYACDKLSAAQFWFKNGFRRSEFEFGIDDEQLEVLKCDLSE